MPVRLRQVLRLRIFKQGLLEVPTSPYLEIDCHRRAWHLLPRRHVRTPAWARVPMWACRLGAGRPVGPGVRGACLRKGRLFEGAGVFGSSGSSYYYLLKIITEQLLITPQSHRAHRGRTETFWGKLKGRLQLADPCRLWASPARHDSEAL